ncbi:protein SODIUM POTASSIUM ROOT DEFECTIVE 2 [Vigna unguiculata]|uniref:Copper chaperone n=1 Tax=Vigna unguiculata TaxID=3917 RepID=A0A4D6LT86_VIGUN|nr:protein SODIUM POTASSIUM ROOT DEFECTIVE 2 [Vigna unguiculata]QCD92132.1 copper chaperone [Vigna unguiculata]
MGKLGRMLDTFCLSFGSNTCFCINSMDFEDEFEKKPLIVSASGDHKLRLKDVVDGKQTLAFQLKPQIVTLRVSMHCYGCAKKVEKHISKLEGVSSYKVDLETKIVVVMGDILPSEVLQSVSKVKNAEIWNSQGGKQ